RRNAPSTKPRTCQPWTGSPTSSTTLLSASPRKTCAREPPRLLRNAPPIFPANRRGPVVSDARTRLANSAIDAFARQGFHATTTRDISLGAGMSPAALYTHFESKERLLFELAKHGHENVLALLTSATRATANPTLAL